MPIEERNVVIKTKDSSGNYNLFYPITKLANVDGMDEALSAKADKAATLAGYGITDAYTKTEADGKTRFFFVTLSADGWVNQRQSVAATGVTAGNATHVFAAPSTESAEQYTTYLDSGIYCAEQGRDTLTFACDSVPAIDLTVSIALIHAENIPVYTELDEVSF